ncbi:MAG: hypothetical protein KF802_11645 [Bdellovibrionaceae bacterium]|nr:hypothetical protein [Pseudobdellovibrionaceae bacterium]
MVEQLRSPRTAAEILTALSGRWDEATLLRYLSLLSDRGLIFAEEGRTKPVPADHPWRGLFTAFPEIPFQERQLEAWNSLSVRLISRWALPEGFFGDVSLSLCDPDDPDASTPFDGLTVFLAPAADNETMERLSRPLFDSGARVLPVLLDPFGALLAPLSGEPGRPCLSCLSRRSRARRGGVDAPFVPPRLLDEVIEAWLPTYWRRLESVLLEEMFKIQSGFIPSVLQHKALIFDFINHRSSEEDVFPVPGCFCNTGFIFQDEGIF